MIDDFDRAELCEVIQIFLSKDDPEDTIPYIQAGDVEDVFLALEALGYKIVKD